MQGNMGQSKEEREKLWERTFVVVSTRRNKQDRVSQLRLGYLTNVSSLPLVSSS